MRGNWAHISQVNRDAPNLGEMTNRGWRGRSCEGSNLSERGERFRGWSQRRVTSSGNHRGDPAHHYRMQRGAPAPKLLGKAAVGRGHAQGSPHG
jgi:hypothetical protein